VHGQTNKGKLTIDESKIRDKNNYPLKKERSERMNCWGAMFRISCVMRHNSDKMKKDTPCILWQLVVNSQSQAGITEQMFGAIFHVDNSKDTNNQACKTRNN
jgi:hypothetical protein